MYKQLWNAGMYWPRMRSQCFDHVKSCDECIRFNVSTSGFRPLRPITATHPFDHVAIDLKKFNKTTPRSRGREYAFLRAAPSDD